MKKWTYSDEATLETLTEGMGLYVARQFYAVPQGTQLALESLSADKTGHVHVTLRSGEVPPRHALTVSGDDVGLALSTRTLVRRRVNQLVKD
jgi:uncharacterized protein YhbP (UPF0306 family)